MRPPAEPAGTAARRAALGVLDAVLRQGVPLEAALGRAGRGLIPADRGLAHAIAAATLRWLGPLDALIDSATPRPLPHDAKARTVLRLALVQALHLGTPPHAAIATSLPLVAGGPRRLVHGVFGTLMRRGATLPDTTALPPAVAERWAAQWGEAMVAAATAAYAMPPPVDLSLKPGEDAAGWAARLGGVSLAPGHVRLPAGTRVDRLDGYGEGAWWVQDLAASLPARLIGTGAGDVLDLCAAPGGKTLQLAAAGWRVTAVDAAASRLARLDDNLARTRLAASVVEADVMSWAPPAPVDAILLDAPCSATGIFRRHPDVLHRVRPADIAHLAGIQAAMLARVAAWLRPGGVLVYAVCSLEQAEGEAQVERLSAAAPGLSPLPATAAELPPGLAPDGAGRVRTLPGQLADVGGLDGFFVARFRRTA